MRKKSRCRTKWRAWQNSVRHFPRIQQRACRLRAYAQLAQIPGKENRLRELPQVTIDIVDKAQSIRRPARFQRKVSSRRQIAKPADMIGSIVKCCVRISNAEKSLWKLLRKAIWKYNGRRKTSADTDEPYRECDGRHDAGGKLRIESLGKR